MMLESTTGLTALLSELAARARERGWSDAEWSRRSGVPKETLSRLKARRSCEFATLESLASATGGALAVRDRETRNSPDGLWPATVDRTFEARLADLVARGSTSPEEWRPLGPPFFLAGLAVMLASVSGFDRQRLLELAEALHPGSTEPRVFSLWLQRTPLPPSRFLPFVVASFRRAA